MIDSHGRIIRKLRISLLDACNMRCFYCMPEELDFLPIKNVPSAQELTTIASHLVSLGVDQIRITGGEPLLRPDFLDIVKGLSSLPVAKLGVTTNAVLLEKYLDVLSKTRCQHINISLDSLRRDRFFSITRKDVLPTVMKSIMKAKELGFKVKVNTVLLKDINDDEVEDFIIFSSENDIEVRFLELMKIGVGIDYFQQHFIKADEIIERVKKKWLLEDVAMPVDSTTFNFQTSSGAQIGFIASESRPFCSSCSRLRLSPEGNLRPCLMINEGPNLRNKSLHEVEDLLYKTVALKPLQRIDKLQQHMYQVGG